LELCLSIASGKKFLDRFEVINPRPVFYIDGEMKLEMMQDRINNIVLQKMAADATLDAAKLQADLEADKSIGGWIRDWVKDYIT